MKVNRKSYIINYVGNKVPKKIAEMDLHCVYISKRFSYAVIYIDANKSVSQVADQLRKTKGFRGISESPNFDTSLNIDNA